MAFINYSTRELNLKIVYYGPGLCGKTTNLKSIYEKVKKNHKGKLISLATEMERTLFFDFFPLDLGTVKGYKVRFHLYTVPGQIYYSSSRKLIMKGVDAIIFIADSQRERYEPNLESLNDMFENLSSYNINLKAMPYVLQLNKRDLPNITPAKELIEGLRIKDEPVIEAMALRGDGVVETLKTISKLILIDVKKKLIDPDESISKLKITKKMGAANNFEYLLDRFHSAPIPVEIANQGVFAIAEYLKSLKNKIKLYEAKLIVVGGGAVGKTSLMKRLLFNEFSPDENITEGIEINNWLLNTKIAENLRINFWDFGGQEIYHATHQFFLTKRSLYIFVWEARKDDDLLNFDYWLNIIKLLSDESPVIIVLNKTDQNIKLIDELSLKKKFKNIVRFFKVSARTGDGIGDLRLSIRQEIVKLPHIGNTLPQLWLEIRGHLEKLDKSFIEYTHYKKICENFGLDKDALDLLSQYLHDLGIFLHFQDNIILRDLIFLKPEWATKAVYKLVNTKRVRENGGKFNYNELSSIWDKYPENKYIFLLELMKRFELCFQIPNSQDYILPQLLPPTESDFEWNYEDNVRFEYHYEFMPAGIIPRFIVRNHDLIVSNLYWQNGVVLNWESSRALVIGEPLKKKIKIWIRGADPKAFLEIIRRDIDIIHKSLNYPEVTELLPCICSICNGQDNPYFFDYSVLKKFKEKSKPFIPCLKSTQDVNIEDLLNGVERALTLKEMEDDRMKHMLFSTDQYNVKNNEKTAIINVFLASSGSLEKERTRVESELSRKNSLLISQNIYLDLKIWEKVSTSFSVTRKQDDFNKLVLDCDIFICLIFDRVGEFTKEEFLMAYDGFLKNKKPKKIYVYFKDAPIKSGQITESFRAVLEFKEEIKKYEQFYNTYGNQDDLILQIIKNLEMDLVDFKIRL